MNDKLNSEKGQVLVIILGVMILFMIFIPALVYYVQQEAKWTEKQRMTNVAFHLAEAGLDRGCWKLNETSSGWDNVINGIIPEGYDGTEVFSDLPKGWYKIKILFKQISATEVEIIIQSVGTELTKSEVRGIKATYTKNILKTPICALKDIEIKGGNVEIHWGPIASRQGDITLSGGAVSDRFPRKFAGKGFRVIPRDPNAAGVPPDEGPDKRNDGSDWVDPIEKEWHSNSDLADVEVTLEGYKDLAKAYRPPNFYSPTPSVGPNPALADPPGSGYFPASAGKIVFKGNMGGKSYRDYCSTATYYIEGDCDIQNNAFIGPDPGTTESNMVTLIVLGSVKMSGTGGYEGYTVKVPSEAYKEYQYVDTAASSEYDTDEPDPDIGYRKCASTIQFPTSGLNAKWPNFCGFMYVGGNLDMSGIQQIVGVVIVKGELTGTGNAQIYYTETVKENVEYAASKWKRNYWSEFAPGNFDAPNWAD